MVAYLRAVEPDCSSKLCFVDAQNSHALRLGEFECAPVPEPVPVLMRNACVVDDGGLWKLALTDPILNQHPAIELIHLRKCRFGGMRQSWHRNFVIP